MIARIVQLVAIALVAGGCEPSGVPPVETPADEGEDASVSGHERMIEILREIRTRTPNENAYLGDAAARAARARYEQVRSTSRATDVDRWRACVRGARFEIRLGNERRAIDLLTEAYGLRDRVRDKIKPQRLDNATFRLGLAHLRHGETQNCCARNTPESCLLPIRGGGIHTQPDGSTRAIGYFSEVLETAPENSALYFKTRWLLNVAHMTIAGYPAAVPEPYRIPPAVFESDEAFPRFENVAGRLGVNSFNLSGGAIVDDFDGDGHLDIVTSTYDPAGSMHFFANTGGGRFADRTEEAGLDEFLGGLNMVQADYDDDGDVDVLVLRGGWLGPGGRHPNSLLANDGNARFTDVTFEAGLGDVHYPTQTASWADYDNDGDLDLYVGNENSSADEDPANGVEGTRGVRAPGQLFENRGDGTFVDVAERAGVQNFRFAKGVVWGDYDGDRYPDLYVSNLGTPNRLYRNDRDGTFTDVAAELGVERPLRSFPAWFWDMDNDGDLDLYVACYAGSVDDVAHVVASYLGHSSTGLSPACLYRNDGIHGFEEVATSYGVDRISLAMGANFGDLDNDGYPDFYLGTGYPDYESLTPNVMYHNREGKRFSDVTSAGGFGHLQKGHGVSFADVDNDGDVDVFEQMGGAFPGDKFGDALYSNPGFGNHWLAVSLSGTESSRCAIGARIRVDVVEGGQRRSVYRWVNSGGSFGGNPLRQTIGLGQASAIERVTIDWPATEGTQTFTGVPRDRLIQITEGEEAFEVVDLASLGSFPSDGPPR